MEYSGSLEELKKRVGLPKDIVDIVEKQLRPLFSNFKPDTPQYSLYSKSAKIIGEHYTNNTKWLLRQRDFAKIFAEGMDASVLSREEKLVVLNFFKANYYLLLVELLGTSVIDKTILLVVGSGVDFHIDPDYQHRYARHVYTLEDLESPSLSLSVKLDFLCFYGLPLFSKFIDRNLRNKIAHLDFEIDAKGNVLVGGKTIDLDEKTDRFIQYYVCINEIFSEEEKKATISK